MVQREWVEKDFYKVLGVSSDADDAEIKRVAKKLLAENHPDRNPNNPAAEERYKEVGEARDVLTDSAKRKEYDEVRAMGPSAMGGRGGPGGFTFNVDDMGGAGGLGDLFGSMFGRGGQGRGRPGGASGVGPRRGTDITAQLTVDFKDAVHGITTTLYLTTDAQCATCNGTGAKPGTSPVMCSACGGRGAVDDNQGMFSFSSPCRVCGGQGSRIEDPCPTCRGSGVEQRQREVKTRIPAGVKDGSRIRLKGKGAPGERGGASGDLYVIVHVSPHPVFARKGDNLSVTVPVTFAEAALGGQAVVPTPGGGTVTLKIPAGTANGRTFRVRGKGVVRKDGTKGDLLASVEVLVPTVLTDEAREALQQYVDASAQDDPRAALLDAAKA